MLDNKIFKTFAFHDFLKSQEFTLEKVNRYIEPYKAAYGLLVTILGLSQCAGYPSEICRSGDVRELRSLAKKIRKHLFWGCKVELRYLLMKQLAYDCSLYNYKLSKEKKQLILKDLFLMKASRITENSYEELLAAVDAWGTDEECATQWISFLSNEKRYCRYKTFNIAVCATMSAGKSTFVNALLGSDVLPARNEATTAKITTVYDKDGLDKVYGFCESGKKIVAKSDNVDLTVLNEWNNSSDIDHVYLQSDFDRIANRNVVVTIHDTPGTNNSANDSHHDVTVEFLKTQKMDAVIYVSNAEQLATCDEFGLLSELYGLTKKNKAPVIFVLNKIDSLDFEKESLENLIKTYSQIIRKVGFGANAKIIPVSAKRARFIKMLYKGKALTKKEMRECKAIMLDLLPDEDVQVLWNESGDLTIKQVLLKKAYPLTGFTQIEECIENIACK